MLHEMICNDDFLRNRAKQYCCVTVLDSYNMVPSNIATQCCTKNRRCHLSQVTSPLGIEDTGQSCWRHKWYKGVWLHTVQLYVTVASRGLSCREKNERKKKESLLPPHSLFRLLYNTICYNDCCNLSSPPASSSFCYLRAEMAKWWVWK